MDKGTKNLSPANLMNAFLRKDRPDTLKSLQSLSPKRNTTDESGSKQSLKEYTTREKTPKSIASAISNSFSGRSASTSTNNSNSNSTANTTSIANLFARPAAQPSPTRLQRSASTNFVNRRHTEGAGQSALPFHSEPYTPSPSQEVAEYKFFTQSPSDQWMDSEWLELFINDKVESEVRNIKNAVFQNHEWCYTLQQQIQETNITNSQKIASFDLMKKCFHILYERLSQSDRPLSFNDLFEDTTQEQRTQFYEGLILWLCTCPIDDLRNCCDDIRMKVYTKNDPLMNKNPTLATLHLVLSYRLLMHNKQHNNYLEKARQPDGLFSVMQTTLEECTDEALQNSNHPEYAKVCEGIERTQEELTILQSSECDTYVNDLRIKHIKDFILPAIVDYLKAKKADGTVPVTPEALKFVTDMYFAY
jgi:hypothetical protein